MTINSVKNLNYRGERCVCMGGGWGGGSGAGYHCALEVQEELKVVVEVTSTS